MSGVSPFAVQCPEAALALMVTIPSARPEIVALRSQIFDLIKPVAAPKKRSVPASVVHRTAMLEAIPTGLVYTGGGRIDCQGRPSPFLNPFSTLHDSTSAFTFFVEYINARADTDVFLRPLAGARCICDCSAPAHECHSEYLVKLVNESSAQEVPVPVPTDSVSITVPEIAADPLLLHAPPKKCRTNVPVPASRPVAAPDEAELRRG